MGKKKPSSKKITTKKVPRKLDLDSVENETLRRVGRTLTTIEEFLAKWDASSLKPDSMYPQVMKIRRFHDALVSWRRDALMNKDEKDRDARMRRLHDFVVICKSYS